MLRLTLILAVALYVVYALGPEPRTFEADGDVRPAFTAGAARAPDRVELETGETWEVDRVVTLIEPPAPAEPGLVAAEEAAAETAAEAPAEASLDTEAAAPETPADGAATRLYVTGDRVNLRAGPSTDDAIVTALDLGTEAELIDEAPDGWRQIRVTATGTTGFMSGDFLSTEAP